MNFTTRYLQLVFTLLFLISSLAVNAQDCSPEECLWPGDANRNGVSNNIDILWIGLALQDELGGASREDASVTWTPHEPPADWGGSHPVSGINYKFADTDGDGWLSGGDLTIFPAVYGQFNDQFTSFLGHEIPGSDLFFTASNLNPAPGETVDISIQLGTEANPINDIYGIAFTVDFDTSIVREQLTTFSNQGGWMFTNDVDFFYFSKQSSDDGLIKPEFAFTSLVSQSASGFGEIVKMSIVVEDVIVGIDGQPLDNVPLNLKFKRVLGLNMEEEDMLITIDSTSLLVTDTREISEPTSDVSIIYQAESDRIIIRSSSSMIQASMINTSGQVIYWRNPKDTELEIFTSGLPAGIYFIQIQTEEGRFVHKIPLLTSN